MTGDNFEAGALPVTTPEMGVPAVVDAGRGRALDRLIGRGRSDGDSHQVLSPHAVASVPGNLTIKPDDCPPRQLYFSSWIGYSIGAGGAV